MIAVVPPFSVDILPSLPIVYKSFRKFDYSLVVPMLLGAIIFSPMGIFILLTMDKQIMELIIGVLIFVLTVRLLINYQPLSAASKKNSVILGGIKRRQANPPEHFCFSYNIKAFAAGERELA